MSATRETTADVTVSMKALWVLQAMLGIPRLAPELVAWPYGAARTDDWLHENPAVEALREQGVVGPDGRVIEALARRLRVLAVPDVEVAVQVGPGARQQSVPDLNDPSTWRSIPEGELRVVLARQDGHWVSAVRAGDDVTIDDVDGGDARWLADLVVGLLDTLHPCGPSRMTAINVPLEEILTAAAERAGLEADSPQRDAALRTIGVRAADLAELGELMDAPVAEAVLYARAHDEAAVHTSSSTLDVRDSDAGRVVLYQLPSVRGAAQEWMTIAPGSAAQVEQGVKTVLAGVGVRSWETHRRS
ncbi:ESX secretion-associated protein EspG [Mycolicibacterium mageritense]|uniref:ESX secretion-associated protein EspG n=1 Tax=Mycolicibacterium mageritense TaxID=53462 RepID=UPI001E43F264|nr:ESX secretion-associated protein EspG [Mycolicibacterium mageritense]GJJ23916.1 ESX secretion-associated protein EspG [Mycolicibacterium mageritense]